MAKPKKQKGGACSDFKTKSEWAKWALKNHPDKNNNSLASTEAFKVNAHCGSYDYAGQAKKAEAKAKKEAPKPAEKPKPKPAPKAPAKPDKNMNLPRASQPYSTKAVDKKAVLDRLNSAAKRPKGGKVLEAIRSTRIGKYLGVGDVDSVLGSSQANKNRHQTSLAQVQF